MKQSSVGELVMGEEQLRGCFYSLLMQEARRRELSPGSALAQSQAKSLVRERNTRPPSHYGFAILPYDMRTSRHLFFFTKKRIPFIVLEGY